MQRSDVKSVVRDGLLDPAAPLEYEEFCGVVRAGSGEHPALDRKTLGLARRHARIIADTELSVVPNVTVRVVSDPSAQVPVPTLFDWAGGDAALSRMINAFYDRVERDDLLAAFFPGGVSAAHRDHVAAWWSEVFGGPARYTAELGGYEAMLAHHKDLAITREQRHRFVSLMSLAADDAGLPDDPEFRSALLAYLEWGTRLAVLNSQPGADVVEHAPVPRWGWGEAPPYQPS